MEFVYLLPVPVWVGFGSSCFQHEDMHIRSPGYSKLSTGVNVSGCYKSNTDNEWTKKGQDLCFGQRIYIFSLLKLLLLYQKEDQSDQGNKICLIKGEISASFSQAGETVAGHWLVKNNNNNNNLGTPYIFRKSNLFPRTYILWFMWDHLFCFLAGSQDFISWHQILLTMAPLHTSLSPVLSLSVSWQFCCLVCCLYINKRLLKRLNFFTVTQGNIFRNCASLSDSLSFQDTGR